jgi:phage gpG-like protein
MPLTIQLQILGDEQMERTLLRSGMHADDLRPVWNVWEEDIRQMSTQQFFSQGSRGSGGWEPLKPSTVAYKASHGLRPEILRATDALFEAMTSPSSPDIMVVKESDEMIWRVIGEPGEYGAIHMSGNPDGNLPQRRPLEFTELDRQRLVRDIQRYVVYGSVEWIDRIL